MRVSDALRQAAWMVESGAADDGCSAIAKLVPDVDYRPPGSAFGYTSEPEAFLWMLFFHDDAGKPLGEPHCTRIYFWGDDRDARVVGLCLAAAIAKAEGK